MDQLTSIVVLHYNRPKDLALCLDSILRNTSVPVEIILVNNGSTDPDAKRYIRALEYVTLIDLPENITPEAAASKAIAIAAGTYIVGMSDDIITTPGWLECFIKHIEKNPAIGLIGPRSNFVSGAQMVQSARYADISELDKFAISRREQNAGRLTPYSRLVGFCWFCRKELIDKIGSLDPSFGFGFSDDDFSLRANLAGFKTAIAQDVFIHHTGGPQGKGDTHYQKMLAEAWSKFKRKWGLPPELSSREYRPKALLNRAFDPNRDYVPLPDPRDVEPYIYRKAQPNYPISPVVSAHTTSRCTSAVPAKAMARGLAAYYLGRMNEAVEIFRELATNYEKSFHIHIALGCILAKAECMEEAIDHLRVAMDLQPNSCKPGNALGRALLTVGQREKAEHAFKEADKVSLYSHQAKFNLVRYYMSERKTDQAMQIAFQAYHRDPNNNKVITILAHLLITSKKYNEATEYLRHYLTLAPKDPDAFLLLFKAYWENRDKKKALEVLTAIKSLAQKDKAVSNRLEPILKVHRKKAKGQQAIQDILRAAGSLFHNLNWEDDFSVDFLVKGDLLEALYKCAKTLYETSRADEAFIIYKKLNKLAPDHALVHNDLATILWDKGDIEAALKHISQAVKLNPWDKDIVWNSGQILLALGRYEDAKNVYQDYLKMHPNDPEIREEIARISSPSPSPQVCTIQPPISKSDQNTLSGNTEFEHLYDLSQKDSRIRFSIIIPTYNRPELLRHTLESLRRQSYRNFKVYLLDNGSQPPVDVTKLPSDIDIEHTRVEKNIKPHHIINQIITRVDGTHLILFADDDVLLPRTLEIVAHIFRQYPEVHILGTAFSRFNHETRQCLNNIDLLRSFSAELIRFDGFKYALKCCAIWGIGKDFHYPLPTGHPSASFLSMDIVQKTLKRQKELLVLPLGDVGFLGCSFNSKYLHYLDLPLVVLGDSNTKEFHGSKLGNRKYWDKYKNDLQFSPTKATSFPNMALESHLKVLYRNGVNKVLDISIRPDWYFTHMRHILSDDPWTPETERDLNEAIPLTIESLMKYHRVSREKAQAYVENWIHEQKAELKTQKDSNEPNQMTNKGITKHFVDINDFARWQEEDFVIPKLDKLYHWGKGLQPPVPKIGFDTLEVHA